MNRRLSTAGSRLGILILGPPGAGKTTLALGLCQRFPHLGHFAPRRFLLDGRRRGTERAARAFAILEHATLLPDEFLVEAAAALETEGRFRGGLVFEGLPVSIRQGELLWDAVLDRGDLAIVAFTLRVSEAVMQARAATRRTCVTCEVAGRLVPAATVGVRCPICGEALEVRSEDSPERLVARLEAQQREAEGVTSWLASRAAARIICLDGECSAGEVLEQACRLLAGLVERDAFGDEDRCRRI